MKKTLLTVAMLLSVVAVARAEEVTAQTEAPKTEETQVQVQQPVAPVKAEDELFEVEEVKEEAKQDQVTEESAENTVEETDTCCQDVK